MSNPFFSIIIASFNAEKLIEGTIRSVLGQDFSDYEIVVKDAKSKDNTLLNIPKDERIRIYSQEDAGIYDGMNEAISYAKGKYLIFLNCGDYFENDTVLSSVYERAVSLNSNLNIIYGNYVKGEDFKRQPSIISPFFLYRNTLCHQSVFFGKELFNKFGKYDLEYKICADYEFIVKAYVKKVEFIYVPIVVCNYLPGGFSESKENKIRLRAEHKAIVKKYFTKSERFKYGLIQFITLKPLRMFLASDKSPAFLRRVYKRSVNKITK